MEKPSGERRVGSDERNLLNTTPRRPCTRARAHARTHIYNNGRRPISCLLIPFEEKSPHVQRVRMYFMCVYFFFPVTYFSIFFHKDFFFVLQKRSRKRRKNWLLHAGDLRLLLLPRKKKKNGILNVTTTVRPAVMLICTV